MERVDKAQLDKYRLSRARALAEMLREEIEELKRRLNLVEVHNEELQQLFDAISADQAVIESAIEASIADVQEEDVDTGFAAGTNDEIADAEDFGIDGSDEEDDFDLDDEDF